MLHDYSPLNWIAENLRIINKSGELVNLEPNEGQYMLSKAISEQRNRGLPVRIVLLKPRQVGWSTWSEAELFCQINMKPNRTALVVSADTESTDMVFNMTRLFQDQMPKIYRKATRSSNRKEIVFDSPHRSKFLTQTAGKDVLGRGGTVHYLHLSEFAFWPKAKEGFTAVTKMVPKGNTDTMIIVESTANGMGGAFYELFWNAVEKIDRNPEDYSGFIPVFFPWFKFPEYSIEPGYALSYDEDERELRSRFGLTDGQLYFRRLQIEECGGDLGLFRQEFPATAKEAFQTSGNPVFSGGMLDYQRARCQEPRYCVFNRDELEDVNRKFNCWQILLPSQSGHEYSIGIDTKEDVLSDKSDVKSRLDMDGVAVFDRNTGEFVAIYKGRGNQRDLGEQVYWACKHYNDAWVAPEIPKGLGVLLVLKEAGYENIYNRQVHDEQLVVSDSENLGWRTTTVTRKWLVDGFLTGLRDKSLLIRFFDLYDQMTTFVYDKEGKPIHSAGEHDDLLFAAMIAFQVHLRCPIDRPYNPVSEKPMAQSLSMCNAVDDFEDMFDYDDDEGEYTE